MNRFTICAIILFMSGLLHQSTTATKPYGFEKFETLEFEDELDPVTLEPEKTKSKNLIYNPGGAYQSNFSKFGLHVCTFRPCDCFIGHCYAYCAWNWCYESQNENNTRFYFECDPHMDPWDCLELPFPCHQYC